MQYREFNIRDILCHKYIHFSDKESSSEEEEPNYTVVRATPKPKQNTTSS